MNTLPITDELRELCATMVREMASDRQKVLVDSDDLIQSQSFCGGWDSESSAFAFSFYCDDGIDYIFLLAIDDVVAIARGGSPEVSLERWKRWRR
ncbi:MAG: hypothetical protein K2Q20_04245 [Phycisphaerales bacterium]|nr:hypothetical protein [Phycisphaerales bacterium]